MGNVWSWVGSTADHKTKTQKTFPKERHTAYGYRYQEIERKD